MSKRKNRNSSPNIPQATLDRARQQITGESPAKPAESVEETPVRAEAAPIVPAAPRTPTARVSTARPRSSSNRRRAESAQPRGGRKDQLDTEIVKNRLLHPTRMVTQEQLREEYGYVIHDLRAIAIIAIAMIVFMVVLAQVI
jgi:hypothetical protein